MKRILIATVAGLSLLATPISALADRQSKSARAHDQQWHSHRAQHRSDIHNERRSGIEAREKHQRHVRQHRVYRTDHKAVKQRVAKHQLAREYRYQKHHSNLIARHYKHDRRWVLNHRDNRRFVTRRAFYNHYYSPGKIYFYDQHRRHYHKYHSHHARYSGVGHHDHKSDYLEWLSIMVLLNEIYGDEHFYAHGHHS
ncbi:MAG: hypothetical protein P8M77_03805 [Porticoccaceae bacterium]|nr:hypothetical protein [Porticoccaceae bacterium]